MLRTALATTVALALALPAVASAHVTLQPNTAVAGTYTRLDVRVPNERDDASTNKVEVQFPDGFAAASYEPAPGWDVKVTKRKLATPVKTDDGEITEGVDTITWTAKDDKDAIPPGAFMDFGLSVQVPGKAGDKLTFKALQTYTGGEVVRWIGAEGSDNPAPTISVTGSDTSAVATASPQRANPAPAASDDDGDSNGLAIVALIVGAIGLLTGGAGLIVARRASGRSGAAA
ncbi:MAG TPA: YcnI family protein [Solirubrobacter sp.]|nr:YcnI family protein [Solirubrobacter sp.]